MNDKIRLEFMESMKPIILELADGWFPPDKKTPDGKYHYACTYCDQNCSRHDKHDDTCLYQMAKNTVERWADIDKETKWDYSPIGKKEKRTAEEVESFRSSYRYWAIFDHFVKNASHFVPLDYSDPNNTNIICSCCSIFEDGMMDKHADDCPYVRVADALHKLFAKTDPKKQIDNESQK